MSAYALHPDAFADLDEIWEYIAQDNVDAAGFSPTSIRPSPCSPDHHRSDIRRQDLTTQPLRSLT
jgi:hypothetical protein